MDLSKVFVVVVSFFFVCFVFQFLCTSSSSSTRMEKIEVLGLEEEFPDAEFHWKKEALESAICKGVSLHQPSFFLFVLLFI